MFDLRSIQVVVLDEADRMFDLGFITDIRYIMRRLPPPDQRLNLLFSATLAQRVLELAFEHMNDPELVRIEPDKMTVDRVRQVIYYPSMDEKPRLLVGLLRQMDPHRTMVFVNTRRGAEELETLLKANGFNAEAISGDVPQNKRLRMIRDFLSGDLAILIGTDVASRGLHVPGRQPRLQLRPAAGPARLRAPHRPHRARRRRRRRDQPRLRGLRAVPAGHRGLHRPQDSRWRASRRNCSPRSPCRATSAGASAARAAAPRHGSHGGGGSARSAAVRAVAGGRSGGGGGRGPRREEPAQALARLCALARASGRGPRRGARPSTALLPRARERAARKEAPAPRWARASGRAVRRKAPPPGAGGGESGGSPVDS